MELLPVKVGEMEDIKLSFQRDKEGSILLATARGRYRRGSRGNADGAAMYCNLAAHYLLFEPMCVILDLSGLEYEWGNTFMKLVNFFAEIGRDEDERNRAVIIVRPRVSSGLDSLEKLFNCGRRIYCMNLNDAIAVAEKEVATHIG